MIEILKQWDANLFIKLNSLGVEQYDAFWLFVTDIVHWTPLYLLFIGLIFYYHSSQKAKIYMLYLLVVVALTVALTGIVKESVGRIRPSEVASWSGVIRVLQNPSRFSFFSGHASFGFAVTTFIVLVLRKQTRWIYLAFAWPILLIFSRIYIGVHYPSDVLVGALVGMGIAGFGYWKCENTLQSKNVT